MSKITVQKTVGDGAYELYGWYRVAASDGSTIAYVPDSVTAGIVARAIEAVASTTRSLSGATTFGYDRAGGESSEGGFMCGQCGYCCTKISEYLDHNCPGPPPRPADGEPNACPECGREYE